MSSASSACPVKKFTFTGAEHFVICFCVNKIFTAIWTSDIVKIFFFHNSRISI